MQQTRNLTYVTIVATIAALAALLLRPPPPAVRDITPALPVLFAQPLPDEPQRQYAPIVPPGSVMPVPVSAAPPVRAGRRECQAWSEGRGCAGWEGWEGWEGWGALAGPLAGRFAG